MDRGPKAFKLSLRLLVPGLQSCCAGFSMWSYVKCIGKFTLFNSQLIGDQLQRCLLIVRD